MDFSGIRNSDATDGMITVAGGTHSDDKWPNLEITGNIANTGITPTLNVVNNLVTVSGSGTVRNTCGDKGSDPHYITCAAILIVQISIYHIR